MPVVQVLVDSASVVLVAPASVMEVSPAPEDDVVGSTAVAPVVADPVSPGSVVVGSLAAPVPPVIVWPVMTTVVPPELMAPEVVPVVSAECPGPHAVASTSPKIPEHRVVIPEKCASSTGNAIVWMVTRPPVAEYPTLGPDSGPCADYPGRVKRALPLTALVLAACGSPPLSATSTGPGVTSVSATTGGSSSSGDASSTSTAESSASSSESSSAGTLRDVGADTDFGTGQPPGCKGKVDLLFLIARNANMEYAQDQLLASFPGFIDTIEERLEGFDLHIMAANPDGDWPGFNCQTEWACGTYWPHCAEGDENWDCVNSVQEWRPCDSKLGAGLTFNAGEGTMNKRCELYDGNRYIVSDEPDLAEQFECIAAVGTWGPYAACGDALIAAVSPELNGVNGCNEGFLRDDALLVVAIIDNTLDEQSISSAYTQYDAIVAAKKDPRAVVMLAVTGFPPKEGEPLDPDCIYDHSEKNAWVSLFEMFPYRLRGDSCLDSYAPFFDEAVGMIDEACGSFVPQ